MGGLGVVITLAYLATQIRRNTKVTRSAAFQSVVQDTLSITDMLVQDPELNRIWWAGSMKLDSLSSEDRARFDIFMISWFRRIEHLHFQVEDGIFELRDLDRMTSSLQLTLGLPGIRAWWSQSRGVFDPRVGSFVDSFIGAPAAQQGVEPDVE